MDQSAFNTAEPIMNEIRALNKYIPLVQAGTVKHIVVADNFPNEPALRSIVQAEVATVNAGAYLTALQARLTNRQTALAAV